MLSEAVHSLADTANQALLFIGISRSQKAANARIEAELQEKYPHFRFLDFEAD